MMSGDMRDIAKGNGARRENAIISKAVTVFPRLDALHVLDASTHFDAGWGGRNTF